MLSLPASPKLLVNYQPRGTAVAELYDTHISILDQIAADAGVKPIPNAALDEILGSENRQMALQREYLESIGWVTEEYLLTQSGGDKKRAHAIYVEIQKILEEEQEGALQRD